MNLWWGEKQQFGEGRKKIGKKMIKFLASGGTALHPSPVGKTLKNVVESVKKGQKGTSHFQESRVLR